MRTQLRLIALLLPLAALALPAPAAAQWYPAESHLRLNMKPREALVYLDGYFAGTVDDFDGQFQRLHVPSGEHEIIVYLEGYRALKQHVYLGPNATRTIDGSLQKLGAGEAQEPKPEPPERDRMAPPEEMNRPAPQRRPMPQPGPASAPQPPRAPRPEPSQPSRFASLSIRVQPGGATIHIDGERWDGPSNDEHLIVQVAEGHHVIQVERDGYEAFTTELDVRRGDTAPVNVSLRRR